MQSVHQSILEYTYQFTIAERTQERLNEIAYTTFVTITSTLIVMGATWGLNKAFAGFEANVYANAASKSLAKFGAASKAYQKIQSMAQQALIKSGQSLAFNMFKVTCAVITETLEELYVDPMIEAYVTNKVADMGWSETSQILLSGLAESGREQFLSSVTSFMRAGFGGRTQVDTNIQQSATNIPNTIESNLENSRVAQEAKAQQQLRQEYIKEGLSAILMFAGAMAGGFGGSIGTALGNVMMVGGVSVEGIDSIKDMFETVLKGRPKKIDILGPQLIKSLQAYVDANNFIQQEIAKAKDSVSVLTDEQKQFLMVSPKSTPFVGSDVKSVGSARIINKFINQPVTRHGTTYGFIDEKTRREIVEKEQLNKIKEKVNDFTQKIQNIFGDLDLREDIDKAVDLMKERMDYYTKHSLFAIKDENTFKALLDRDNFGVIYIVWRVKDQNGNLLAEPQPYVGQTANRLARNRFNDEKSKARRVRKTLLGIKGVKETVGKKERYLKLMASYDESICTLDEAFILQVWDIAYSRLELDIKEAFWTDHFDSDNPEIGLNYFRGPPKWGYSRVGGTYITRSDLIQGIFEGLDYKGFKEDQRFKKSASMMREYIQKHIRDEDGNIVKGVREARIVLIKPYLKEAISQGLDRDGVQNYLHAHGITMLDVLYPGTAYGKRYSGLNYFIKKCFNGWSFDKCREEFYIKPLVQRLQSEGILIPGIGEQQLGVEDFPELVETIRRTNIKLSEGIEDLGLIETLILNGVRGRDLSKALGLWEDGASDLARRNADNKVKVYIWHRWGFSNENELITFLTTNFLDEI